MNNFKEWFNKNENYGGSANFVSGVGDEGDGGDGVINMLDNPGAFPTYGGDDLPINKKNINKKRTKTTIKNKYFSKKK